MSFVIGTAGWTIPRQHADYFPAEGSSLERYAHHFAGVEINSSFYRSHRATTWERWSASVPDNFFFSVKLPREVSHVRKLVDCRDILETFLEEVVALRGKLAVLLLQLPPKLPFEASVANPFLETLCAMTRTQLVCEPRHPSWFGGEADPLLRSLGIARVAADPSPAEEGELPGGSPQFRYWRLHGSPRIYRSSYDDERLERWAGLMRKDLEQGRPTWCIFDNTAGSAAVGDALRLEALVTPAVRNPV